MKITARTMTGIKYDLEVEETVTVSRNNDCQIQDLKNMMQEKTTIDATQLKFIFKGKPL